MVFRCYTFSSEELAFFNSKHKLKNYENAIRNSHNWDYDRSLRT